MDKIEKKESKVKPDAAWKQKNLIYAHFKPDQSKDEMLWVAFIVDQNGAKTLIEKEEDIDPLLVGERINKECYKLMVDIWKLTMKTQAQKLINI
jgi:hypothetical protein